MKSNKTNIDFDSYIDLLKKGDVVAFETLFRLYYDKLLHISKGYLNNYQNAEEIVQNVFLKLWENRKDLKKVRNMNGYLYAMTRNACLDQLKHEKIKINYSKDIINRKAGIHNQFMKDEAASLLLKNELEKKILESIDLLPEKCKKVFMKSRFEGMKHQEISELLGVSKRTVDSHISNALKHMRFHLKEFITLLFLFLVL